MFASKDLFFTKPSGGYQISRSVRTRSSATAYFNRTLTTPTLGTKWTWSGWVKRGTLGSAQTLFGGSSDINNWGYFGFLSGDTLTFQQADAGSVNSTVTTTQVFRDPSSWYHLVVLFDSTQATAANRLIMYVNGVQITAYGTATYLAQNTASRINQAVGHTINRLPYSAANYVDGYITEINFIDGQALTPSSFGQTNSVTGVWQPIKYGGTYGTNGFYLNFSDNSNNTAATIGKDYSGNGNNWTPNNISVTAGTTYDSMLDVPTLYADGGNGRGNYSVLNPVIGAATTATYTITQANLYCVLTSSTNVIEVPATMALPTSGQWYWEINVVSVNTTFSQPLAIGISDQGGIGNSTVFTNNYYYYLSKTGNKYSNGTLTAYGATYTASDVIGVAFDAGAGTLTFYKNNTSQGTAFTSLTAGPDYPKFGSNDGCTFAVNFGQRPFSYTPPTGFVALNTQNLPTPTISNGANYMAATTYTGTGASLTIANTIGSTSFQPDFVWVKGRSGATDHALYDSVRGTTKDLVSNSTAAETTQATGLTAFGSTGFTVGALAKMNTNAATYVGWQWNAGGSTVTNTSGSISAQVRANPTAGFSVLTYTGTGSAATVGHGLGVAPRMMIMRSRTSTGSNGNWVVYHASLGATNYLVLNDTAASASDIGAFNNTSPTSSVFSVGTFTGTNGSSLGIIAYCFAEVAGYSKFGSYTGNGSADGPFVYCGFRPRYVLLKNVSSSVTNWWIMDTSRDTYNLAINELRADTSNVELTTAYSHMDILSNGFKLRASSNESNGSGNTVIFAAFAENPFKNALAR
jgi:hypothetical protein